MTDADSGKLGALLEQLREIGVGPGSDARVVVFSERVQTLEWLAKTVPAALGFTGQKAAQEAARVMHGGLSDEQQMQCVEDFGLADTPVRVLFTGDVASEGVNLHRQCHQLIHYDMPWSLIRIEQRNGRIDRYGQYPRTRVPCPDPHQRGRGRQGRHPRRGAPAAAGGRGPPGPGHGGGRDGAVPGGGRGTVAGQGPAARPHGRGVPRRPVREVRPPTTAWTTSSPTSSARWARSPPGTAGRAGTRRPARAGRCPGRRSRACSPPPASSSTRRCARSTRDARGSLDLSTDDESGLLSFVPPPDLLHRLKALPPDYVREQRLRERLLVTLNRRLAEHSLQRARASATSSWPEISLLTDLHPVVEWLTDKVLVRLDRQEAPVVTADVDAHHVPRAGRLLQRPGPAHRREVDGRSTPQESGEVSVDDDMVAILRRAGVGPSMANPNRPYDTARLAEPLERVLDAAEAFLEQHREAWDAAAARAHRGVQAAPGRLAAADADGGGRDGRRPGRRPGRAHQGPSGLPRRLPAHHRPPDAPRPGRPRPRRLTDSPRRLQTMTYDSLVNRGDYFSAHYLAEVLPKDLKSGLLATWKQREAEAAEAAGAADGAERAADALPVTPRAGLRALRRPYFRARSYFALGEEREAAADDDAADGGVHDDSVTYDSPQWRERVRALNADVLRALGFDAKPGVANRGARRPEPRGAGRAQREGPGRPGLRLVPRAGRRPRPERRRPPAGAAARSTPSTRWPPAPSSPRSSSPARTPRATCSSSSAASSCSPTARPGARAATWPSPSTPRWNATTPRRAANWTQSAALFGADSLRTPEEGGENPLADTRRQVDRSTRSASPANCATASRTASN